MMKPMEASWEQLRERLAEIDDLHRAVSLLDWDQNTYMPPHGATARAEQIATLRRLAHERFVDETTGQLLDALADEARAMPADAFRAALWWVTRRKYEQAVKVPASLIGEMALSSSQAFNAWVKAREQSDFKFFLPHLEHQIELQQCLAEHLGYEKTPYDALLDIYEPEMRTEKIERLFQPMRQRLVGLLDALRPVLDRIDDAVLRRPCDDMTQLALMEEVLGWIGFDFERGRQDVSPHPFTISMGTDDVRLTTCVDERFLWKALHLSLHEGGHGLYAQGIPSELARGPLGGDVQWMTSSAALHESQARLWENVVGRSYTFCRHLLPRLKHYLPTQFADVSVEVLYAAINKVSPGYIRLEADEVSYNLHIFLRFELERELIEGRLEARELPERWWEGMRALLGLPPGTDAEGVLQDVHWSFGLFGYFPTYALGNLLSVQLYQAALSEDPAIEAAMDQGNYHPLLEWMRTRIHIHGAKWPVATLVRQATDEAIRVEPFLDYIEAKYNALYEHAL